MQPSQGYILKDCSLECSQCRTVFAVRVLADLPPVTLIDKIEADLHRVLPHPALRGALIAVCPSCGYADWATRYVRSIINPLIALPAADLDHSKKFAMAVKWARQQKLQPLDIAYIALNGLYCARESGQPSDAWLELCVFEQSRGLDDEDLAIETGQDHLVMAELWRQLGWFDKAMSEYEKSRNDGSVPEELIRHQLNAVKAGDREPTILPPAIVSIIYPDALDLTQTGEVTIETLQRPIVQSPNPLFGLEQDEATGRFKPAPAAERPKWAANTRFDIEIEPELEPDDEVRAALAEAEALARNGLLPAGDRQSSNEEPIALDTVNTESADAGRMPALQVAEPVAPAAADAGRMPALQVPEPVAPAAADAGRMPALQVAEPVAPAAADAGRMPTLQVAEPVAPAAADAGQTQALQDAKSAAPAQPLAQAVEPLAQPLTPAAQPIVESTTPPVLPIVQPLPPTATEFMPTGKLQPVAAEVQQPVVQEEQPQAAPVTLVKHVIAMPDCAGTISLVHSNNSAGLSVVVSQPSSSAVADPGATAITQAASTTQKDSSAPAVDTPVGKQRDDRTHKAVNRALKVVDSTEAPQRPLPEVHLFDDDHAPQSANDHQKQQAQPTAPNNDKNPQEAIAQVESFLNLTRQPGYQNWIRGYRR